MKTVEIINADTGETFIHPEVTPTEVSPTGSALNSDVGLHTQDNEVMAGWCPNGSWSGGICRPANNNRSRWMETYSGARVLPIGEVILLGTHNSGFDKWAPSTPSMETCQDVPVYDQLTWGVRVLDLRVQFISGASGVRRFSIFHSTTNGRYVESDILQPLLRYRQNERAGKEIVILNFHQFKNFTAAAHAELAGVLKRVLGDAIVPVRCKEAAVVQLWSMKMNTIISYNSGSRDRDFWPGVNQRWIGSNTPTKNELANFIKRVAQEPKAWGDLRAVQAAYYSLPFFVPKDLSGDLMSWFAATDEGGPIIDHYIINTDWSLRHRLADNVIYANSRRARRLGAHVIESSPATSGALVQTQSYGTYFLRNGNWAASLAFTANTSGYPSVQLIASDADWVSEIKWAGNQHRSSKKGDRLLFKVESGKPPQLLAAYNIA